MKKYVKSSEVVQKAELNALYDSVIKLEDKLEYTWKTTLNNNSDSELAKQSMRLYSTLLRFNDYVVEEMDKMES